MITRSKLVAAAALGILWFAGCGDNNSSSTKAPPLTVMTYNVLCSFCNPREFDPWDERVPYFGDIFRRHNPDLIGLQELTPLNDEVGDILTQLPGYAPVYYDPAGATPYPDAIILYRTSRFTLVDRGEYWLSPTPDTPLTTGFAPPQFPRLVVWATLRDNAAGRREIFFATTHFDNNTPSQRLSSPLLQQRTAPFEVTMPTIVVGDFNSRPDSTAYGILTTDASNGFVFANTFELTSWRMIANQTPTPAYDVNDRIDHIFLAGARTTWNVTDWVVDLTTYGAKGRYPSDHFPVTAVVEY